MKTLSIFILSCLPLFAVAQTNQTADVNQTIINNTIQFEFVSNKTLDEFIEQKWEHRFPLLHPDLISIDINPDNQMVTLLMEATYSQESLTKMIQRFDFTNFQITE